jgi:hypothetical protein
LQRDPTFRAPVTERPTTKVVTRPQVLPTPRVDPSVSVVVPCFNYERYVRGAVQSALGQVGVRVQVIVVDDASDDDSVEVVEALAAEDPRVVLVRHRTNQGPVATFNDGLELATGTYLVRLDADDLLTPGSLARSVALLDAWPTVGLVYGHPLHFTGDVLPPHEDEVRSWTVWPGVDWLELRCRSGVNCITSPEVVMRSSVVAEVGGQRELAHTHDMEMWMRISAVSDVGHVDGPDQAWHRDHDQSLSAREVDVLTDLRERRDAFDVLFDGVAGQLDAAPRLRALAHRALAGDALDRVNRAYDRGKVDSSPVEEYLEFARGLDVDVESLPQWRGYLARRRWGPSVVPLLPQYFGASVLRRLREDRARRHWHRTGT